MRKTISLLVLTLFFVGCKEDKKEKAMSGDDTILEKEESVQKTKDEWIVLFDGTSFDSWEVYPDKEIPDYWVIEEGAMVLNTEDYRPDGERFNLVTRRTFTSFVLSLEWRLSEGANSGVMWGVKGDPKYVEPYHTGPEIQVLDNINHPDSKIAGNHQAGSLYDMVAPTKDVTKPIGQWNSYVITVDHDNNTGSVVLNGEKIVEFPVNGPEWDNMVAKSKFADWPDFGKYRTGKIALQDHGEPLQIAYRNIKIKEL
jgi:hypothetical protein